jgi:hypothetical protein
MRGGRALLTAARAPSPLERLLASTRAALSLLADVLRPSGDPQDTPVMTLGHHYISVREVSLSDPAQAGGGSSRAAGGRGAGGAARGASGAAGVLRLQEICTFDPDEGPKRYSVPKEEVGPLSKP